MENDKESILAEAYHLVHGERGVAYGHPYDDFGRTAGMVSEAFKHKLKEPLTQEDIAIFMICVKVSRFMNKPSRDSVVDMAGYPETLWMVYLRRKQLEREKLVEAQMKIVTEDADEMFQMRLPGV